MPDLMTTVSAHLMEGETTAALAALDEHLTQHPDDQDARRLRAETHLALGTPDDLRAALDDFAALSPHTSDDTLCITRAYERLNLPEQAIEALQAGLALDPTHPRLLQRLAEVLLSVGRYHDALDEIKKLPPDWRKLQMVGDVMFDLGLKEPMARPHCITAYQSALEIIPLQKWSQPFRARMHLRLANVNMRLGDYKAVEREAATVAKLIPNEPAVAFYQGWAQIKRGKPERALPMLKKAFAKASDVVRAEFRAVLADDPECAALLDSLETL
jgi:tetratricopeptide (TPR) repeat protein